MENGKIKRKTENKMKKGFCGLEILFSKFVFDEKQIYIYPKVLFYFI